MESGDSKKRKRKSVHPEGKSKASYVDLFSSRKSTLKAQNVVEVSSSKQVKVKKGKITSSSKANSSDDDFLLYLHCTKLRSDVSVKRVYPATSYWSGKKVGDRLKSLQHFGDVDVIETYKDNVDDDDSQTDGNVVRQSKKQKKMKEKKKIHEKKKVNVSSKKMKSSEMKKTLDKEVKDDVILDKGKKVVEDISEKDVREKDDVSEEVLKSVDHNSDFDVILDGSRSLEKRIYLNEEGTSGKENELSVTQLLDDPNFCAEIERNALAVIAKQSTTSVVVSEGLVGSVGVQEEISDEELIKAIKIISQINLGKQEVQSGDGIHDTWL
ncbi:hypothetical protein L1887_18041 [Cichorium endivia]|nr:hypothetical protein L1887_18041 [Cichorium endivia]